MTKWAFPNTQISQSVWTGPVWGEFPSKDSRQKSQNLTPTFELCRTAAGLSARHRRSSWSVFSILSKNLIGLKRSRLGCILLHCPGEGDEGGKLFCTLSLPNLVSRNPPGGIYRGEGQCSSDWAASKRLPFSRLSFSKFQIFDKHVFYSKLLEKCIGDVPVAFWALLRHSLRKIILPKGFLKGIGAPKRARS